MTPTAQCRYDVRFDWGLAGLLALRDCRTFIIVDVLSFSTCVSLAVDRAASILPFAGDDAAARILAAQRGAMVAGHRGDGARYSLSPQSLLNIAAGTKLVLPSPNGSTLSVAAATMGVVLAGCFRNRSAVADIARSGAPIAVIAAGERWPDGSLRPCFEDLCGAGAIIRAVDATHSPEALSAAAAFASCEAALQTLLFDSVSGRELVERGFPDDVRLAAAIDASRAVPVLRDGVFVRAS